MMAYGLAGDVTNPRHNVVIRPEAVFWWLAPLEKSSIQAPSGEAVDPSAFWRSCRSKRSHALAVVIACATRAAASPKLGSLS